MIFFNEDLGAISVAEGQFSAIAKGEAVEKQPRWSHDGKTLAFLSFLDERTSIAVVNWKSKERRDFGEGLLPPWGVRLFWGKDASTLFFEAESLGQNRQGPSALYALSLHGGAQSVSSPRARSDYLTSPSAPTILWLRSFDRHRRHPRTPL